MDPRHRGQRGIALPSPVAVVSLAAVVVAAVAFAFTGGTPAPTEAATPVTATPTKAPAPRTTAPEPVIEKKKQKKRPPRVVRADVLVEVYNNSGISGLAGSTAGTIDAAGWQVVGADNWYGTIPASTVYYPERLRAEAKLLAKDLGVTRMRPAISPMRFDRLTVILTADFA